MKMGKGKMVYACGDVYEGQYTDDIYQGYGRLDKENGDLYEGFWRSGYKNGLGTQTWTFGFKLYEGNFVLD